MGGWRLVARRASSFSGAALAQDRVPRAAVVLLALDYPGPAARLAGALGVDSLGALDDRERELDRLVPVEVNDALVAQADHDSSSVEVSCHPERDPSTLLLLVLAVSLPVPHIRAPPVVASS